MIRLFCVGPLFPEKQAKFCSSLLGKMIDFGCLKRGYQKSIVYIYLKKYLLKIDFPSIHKNRFKTNENHIINLHTKTELGSPLAARSIDGPVWVYDSV